MNIIYKDTHHFDPQALQSLFLSVDWSSGHYPDKLAAAMKNYETVFSAWDGERLIGLLSAMDDGVMTAYIHYLLVDLAYQHRGIGRRLVEQAKEKYRDYHQGQNKDIQNHKQYNQTHPSFLPPEW